MGDLEGDAHALDGVGGPIDIGEAALGDVALDAVLAECLAGAESSLECLHLRSCFQGPVRFNHGYDAQASPARTPSQGAAVRQQGEA